MADNNLDSEQVVNKDSSNETDASNPANNDLLDMVFALESEKQQLVEESRKRIAALRKELEVSFWFGF